MSRSKNLAVKYLIAAVLFFGVMTLSGRLAATYYINPEFLFGLCISASPRYCTSIP